MITWLGQYWLQVLFGLITASVGALWRHIIKTLKLYDQRQKSLISGVQAILRDRIIQAYNHYMDLGYCPINVLENIHLMYKEYRYLNGNEVVSELVERIDKLPHQKRDLPGR